MEQRISETIGVDLGDRHSAYCIVDQASAEERRRGSVRTTPRSFERFLGARPLARVVMEVGTHLPWASRIVSRACRETYVANARQLRFIFGNTPKSDQAA